MRLISFTMDFYIPPTEVEILPKAYRRAHRQIRRYARRRLYAAGIPRVLPDSDLTFKIRHGKIVNVHIGLVDPGVEADTAAERNDDPEPEADTALH